MSSNSPCVLVCVSGKKDCGDLIAAGKAIAKRDGIKLQILIVLPQNACFYPDVETLDFLYNQAKQADAEMNVFFNDEPVLTAAQFAEKSRAFTIVTGFPDVKSSHFVSKLHSLIPNIPISMVKENKVYHISNSIFKADKNLSDRNISQFSN